MLNRILITGSRKASDDLKKKCENFLNSLVDSRMDTVILVGDAEGIDEFVIDFCDKYQMNIFVHGAYGRLKKRTVSKNGFNMILDGNYFYRDDYMAMNSDECIAFWDGQSHGTKHTFDKASSLCTPTTIVTEGNVEFRNQ